MKIFKPSRIKIICSIMLSFLLIFFYVPIVFQYCQPIEGEFGGGGCGPGFIQNTIYPIPNVPQPTPMDNVPYNPPSENVTFYPLSYLLLQGTPSLLNNAYKNSFYVYSPHLILGFIMLSYIFFCLLVELINKLKKKNTYAKKRNLKS